MRNISSTLLYNWFNEVWTKNNENAIDDLMSEDADFRGIETNDGAKGASGFKLFFRDFTSQFHNVRAVVEDVISQDDMEAARTVLYAKHVPTDKDIVLTGICMVKIADGKIVEAWNSYDFLSLNQQLGQKLVPE